VTNGKILLTTPTKTDRQIELIRVGGRQQTSRPSPRALAVAGIHPRPRQQAKSGHAALSQPRLASPGSLQRSVSHGPSDAGQAAGHCGDVQRFDQCTAASRRSTQTHRSRACRARSLSESRRTHRPLPVTRCAVFTVTERPPGDVMSRIATFVHRQTAAAVKPAASILCVLTDDYIHPPASRRRQPVYCLRQCSRKVKC